MQQEISYSIQEHVHRFRTWAASTSNGRFPVSTGQVILREAGFRRYLKAVFVTLATSGHPKVGTLHPPVDRLLRNQLARSGGKRAVVWARYRDRGWSNFDSGEYEAVIADFRAQLGPDSPLWRIESHWSGFQ